MRDWNRNQTNKGEATMASRTKRPSSGVSNKKECLLGQPNAVSGAGESSFGSGEPDWEANTLPLSYTRESPMKL